MGQEKKYYDDYWQKGWVVIEEVFRPDDVDRVADMARALAEEESRSNKPGYLVDLSDDGERAPRKIDDVFLRHPIFRDFVLDKRLVGKIEILIGGTPLLLSDGVFMKPPRHGSAKPYHQDNFYFRCHPDDQVITAWIALDDVNASNGCLRYIDGSHLGPILPHHPVPGQEDYNSAPPSELIDLGKESLSPVRKGGVVFHHAKTLHSSHRNESNRWRRGYATNWVTVDVRSEINTLDRAYFRMPEFRELFPVTGR